MPPLPAWTPLALAPFVGSLLGLLAMRLPDGRPVAWARSTCESCHATLRPAELVPLLSYAMQRGRCRHCRAPIPASLPAVELAALAVAAICMGVAGPAPVPVWGGCLLGWAGLLLAWIDLRWLRLPDVVTLPLLLAGLGVCVVTTPERLGLHAAGAAAGYAGFRLLSLAYRRLRGRDGLGQGDAKLLAAAGAWLGPWMLPDVVLLAALITLAATLAWSAARGRRLHAAAAVPFGPGLAAAIWLCWLAAAPGWAD